MTRPLTIAPQPLPPSPPLVVAVDRAVAALRRGEIVVVADATGVGVAVLAAECAGAEAIERLRVVAGRPPALVLSGRRAAVLGLAADAPWGIAVDGPLDAQAVRQLSDPCAEVEGPLPDGLTVAVLAPAAGAAAAVQLAKLARLLPAALAVTVPDPAALAARHTLMAVGVAEIHAYAETAARSMRVVGDARVPLAAAEATRIVAFRPADGGVEHLAIVIGTPDLDAPVLARLHSECFTGDLLGSLRCDCGDQLRGAIAEIAQHGAGVLLYLAQEGRGIGLVNKLRAYRLQDAGFDTLDANGQLGFDDDERVYLPAAEMLRLLGIATVRLMTNNPQKVEALARHGIAVAERVPHVFPANDHSALYLQTKATRGGHLF